MMLEVGMSICVALFIQQIIKCIPQLNITIAIDRLGLKMSDFSYTLYLGHSISFLFYSRIYDEMTHLMTIADVDKYLLYWVLL